MRYALMRYDLMIYFFELGIYQKKLNYFFLIWRVIDCVICEMDTTELKQEQKEQLEQEQEQEQEQLEHRARAMRLKMNERGMWRWALRGIVIQ